MKPRILLLACFVILSAVSIFAQSGGATADLISGTWAGDIGPKPTTRHPVTIELKFDGKAALSGTITNFQGLFFAAVPPDVRKWLCPSESCGIFMGLCPRLFGETSQSVAPGSRFLIDPGAMGAEPRRKRAPFPEGQSHFRTSGGTAAGKT